jgi:NADH-quinone oxidoreductase subunit A
LRESYAVVLVFLAVGMAFAWVSILVSRLVHPHHPTPEKLTTYECGEDPIGRAWVRYNTRFYTVALVFIIFEAEILFMFPWAVAYRKLGLFAFVEMLLFVGILLTGLVYVWAKGDLDWVKPSPPFTRDDARLPDQVRRWGARPARRAAPAAVSAEDAS